MVKNKIYFASDMHLGSDFFENPKISERRLVGWLDSIREDAKALYFLGDIFDFWFEYKKVVPRGFTRFLGKIAEMYDNGTEIHFFTGNHDIWMFDYLPDEVGAIIHKKPLTVEINGKIFYLAHGDGLGKRSYLSRLIRFIFHNRICQWLFAHFPSEWGIGLAHKWSKYRKKDVTAALPYLGEEKGNLVLYAEKYIQEHSDIDYIIFGHRHIMLDRMLNRKTRVLLLGDWMRYFSYAVFDGENLKLEQLTTNAYYFNNSYL